MGIGKACAAIICLATLIAPISFLGRPSEATCPGRILSWLEAPSVEVALEVNKTCVPGRERVHYAPWNVQDDDALAWTKRHAQLRGVNLGGWLLMERWLVGGNTYVNTTCCGRIESPYNGTACDEATSELPLTVELRARGELGKIDRFRETYVTEADFKMLHSRGITGVRIPIGFWIVNATGSEFHLGLGLRYVDNAVRWAAELNMSIFLQLHGAPGGQSGEQTTGYLDRSWTPASFDKERTVEILRAIAQRYAAAPNVIAIGLLNEPHLPASMLLDLYKQAIPAIREHMPSSRVAIVINIYSTSGLVAIATDAWPVFNEELTPKKGASNVLFDLHLYYAFLPGRLVDAPLDFVIGPLVETQSLLTQVTGRPVIVGEWSLRLPTFGTAIGEEFAALPREEQDATLRRFAANQIVGMSKTRWTDQQPRLGGYFWSWNAPRISAVVNGSGCVSGGQAEWGFNNSLNAGWVEEGQWASAPLAEAPAHKFGNYVVNYTESVPISAFFSSSI